MPHGGTHTFQTADEFFAAGTPSCTCDRVHTGACISAADPNDFFCAVTEQVCAANDNSYTYLNAHQVLENLGITCKLCDTVPASPNTLYTHAGACVSSSTNEFRRCALLPEHCSENDEMFVSSRQLEDSSQAVPTAALGCLAEQGLHQVRVGRCVANSDQNICVPDATACKISQSFRPNDDECTLVQDLSSNAAIATTHFGHCTEDETTTFAGYQEGRERYCAWSFQECLSPSAVARPLLFGFANPGQSGSFPQCQCDDVRVGACVSNINPTTDLYCAVGASACDQGYSYQNVRKLEEPSGSNTICHLCQPLPPMSTTTAEGPPPTNPPTSVTMPRPPSNLPTNNRPTPSFQEEFENEYFQDGLEAGAIVGIVFGVLLSSVIFIVAICMFRRGQRQGQSQSSSRQDETNVEPSVATKQSREVENVVELLSPLEEACMEGQTEEDFVPPSKENKVV
ncbi:hypothetical protein IV203_014808 [Nitzschia inconspicua]|uniref:Uncharacterized protein n=1 Tax=Nitzschia inconspicua TaxID=303405 RepID=A0A9K3LBJ6_9STRA|nr:hypothetical protein IV203_020251 [Nitzschia inconspicua]KAG7358221.1 hypothetical protein IV203_014808 [Nitzschia inconspicua]